MGKGATWMLALAGGLGLPSVRAAELVLTNPVGYQRQAFATVRLEELGLAATAFARPAGQTPDRSLAVQIDAGDLAVATRLGAYESAVVSIDPGRLTEPVDGLTVMEDDKTLVVQTPLYAVTFDKAQGYRPSRVRDSRTGGSADVTSSGLVLFEEPEHPTWRGTWFGVPREHHQARAAVAGRVLKRGPLTAELRLNWSCPAAEVEQRLTFSAFSRLVEHDCTVRYSRPLVQAAFGVSSYWFGTARGETLLWPEGERIAGVWSRGLCRPAPRYVFAHTAAKRIGLGVAAWDATSEYFHFLLQGQREGFGGDNAKIDLFARSLRWSAVPGTLQWRWALMVGGTPEEAAAAWRERPRPFIACLPVGMARQPAVLFVRSVQPQRRPLLAGRPNAIGIVVANRGSAPAEAPVRVQVDGREIGRQPVRLAPGSSQTVTVTWTPQAPDEGCRLLSAAVGPWQTDVEVEIARPVTIDSVWPARLLHGLDEPARTAVTLASHSDTAETVDLVCEVSSGLDDRRQVDRRQVVLAPGQTQGLDLAWNSGSRDGGLTFRAIASLGGRAVDVKEEYAAATAFAPQVSPALGILNPSARQEGSEATYVRHFRENYCGLVEYYCWAPDQVLDLTPDEAQWRPHTESQGAYEVTLTRAFLKTLVAETHRQGIHIYAMDTGLMSLEGLLREPERCQYTEDGQPYLYNGAVYEGKRRYAVSPANIYTDEAVRRWGEEMAASVDLFGWDGVRWDWGFVPTEPADPLAGDERHRAGFGRDAEPPWYDFRGRPAPTLFPDPDATGARLLRLWRQTVNQRHPHFVYGTNFSATAARCRTIPQYFKEASRQSLVLFEYLLGADREPYHTWAGWATALTEACQRVREGGAQPSVGYSGSWAPGGTAMALAQHLTFAAGVHWAFGFGPRHSLDDSWKRFRFFLRFAEYGYDPAFRSLPPDRRAEVTVQGSPRVLWQPFVYERSRPTGRDVTVHLLNLPRSDYIVMHHERPEPKRDLAVRADLKAGERLTGAWLLVPEPQPQAIRLDAQTEGQRAVVRVRELVSAAVVVLEVAR